ncbi:MAG: DUF1743 domain-containing protein [Thaumarchaeota archaeon]|nr:DUF1743 domain-containing protein [Nitrososphaerota archaeon]
MKVHIGLDDTDSVEGGCTTHLAKELVKHLVDRARFFDYPHLIRLNPNVPWKTRGNGAVALRFETESPEGTFESIVRLFKDACSKGHGTHPGLVMLASESIPVEIKAFSQNALSNILSVKNALSLIRKFDMPHYWEGRGMGLVGAVAAIGNDLQGDHTFEVLAYRKQENWGTQRQLEPSSVIEMTKKTYPYTYNNFDPETGRILIAPRGPDPILFGVRGEDPQLLLRSLTLLKIAEPVDSYVVFRSNQGTGTHLTPELSLQSLKAYTAGHFTGQVSEEPRIEQGGHVFFKTRNETGETLCAVYEPAGYLRRTALELRHGDTVQLGGGVRRRSQKHPTVINVEYIRVLQVEKQFTYRNPKCNKCSGRMSSMGAGQGYRCEKCGFRDPNAKKIPMGVHRSLKLSLYLPPPRAQRHLTKPLQRYGMEKDIWEKKLVEGWCSFNPEESVCQIRAA